MLRALVVAGSAGYLVLYAVLAALRVRYPFDLEWLEGAMVDHVRMILDGRPLYPPPTLDFIPLTYTPGYFYAAAALCKIVGLGVVPDAPHLDRRVGGSARDHEPARDV